MPLFIHSKDPNAETSAPSVPVRKSARVWIVILPILACLLCVALVFLILTMPETATQKLQPYASPQQTTHLVLAQPSSTVPSLTLPSESHRTIYAYDVTSKYMGRTEMKQMIQTGAGLPGTASALTEAGLDILQNQKTVWEQPALDPELQAKIEEIINPLNKNRIRIQKDPSVGELRPVKTENSQQEAQGADKDSQQAESGEPAPEAVSHSYGEVVSESDFRPTDLPAYVYGSVVNVRADADMNSQPLVEVHAGDVVQEISTNGNWSYVRLADGMLGFIYSDLLSYNYVAPEAPAVADPGTSYNTSDFQPYYGTLYASNSSVNIRSGPSLNDSVIGSMFYGDYCLAVGYVGGWFQIQLDDGTLAYVHGDYLQEEPITLNGGIVHEDVNYVAATLSASPESLAGGAAVVDLALRYLGCPYVWGAAGPSSFDCSGLVYYVHQQMGVTLGRTTYQQVGNGIAVPFSYRDYSALIPGDLLLFAEGSDIYHVGIYIGGGQMVHAGDASTGVIIDDLNFEFWASRLAYVRRVFY